MARPKKQGLDYFPLNTDFFEDDKIVPVTGEFGLKGEIVVIKLLCAIYRNGYFIEWNERSRLKFLRDLPGISVGLLDMIVSRLVQWGFFDQSLFNSTGILTSKGIQRRYFGITNRRLVDRELPHLLVNVSRNPVNVSRNPHLKVVYACRNATKEIKDNISSNESILSSSLQSKDFREEPPLSPFQGGNTLASLSSAEPIGQNPKRKEKVARKRKEPDITFVEPTFQPIMADWLAYKSERGQTYRQKGIEACYSHLLNLSGGNADMARRIVMQSIANNYAGLFPLKPTNNVRSTTNQPPSSYELAQAVADGIARANTPQEWE